jgi:predicted CoA-binding protein
MKTLVLGASENPDRYSNRAIRSLRKHNHEVAAIGLREGNVGDVRIQKGLPELTDVDTVTIYMNAKNQEQFRDYILSLHPRRIIFNPGAENYELEALAREKGISVENACTLVMLATEQY